MTDSGEVAQAIPVEIYGTVYQVRGHEDAAVLKELASLVDGRMREVAEHVRSADPTRVAILTALNLADELYKQRQQRDREQIEIEEKLSSMAGRLADAL